MPFPVYVINAFPGRRESIEYELGERGGVPASHIRWISAPLGLEAGNLGWHACLRWRDPYSKRLLTWGELACFAGHVEAWRQIEANGDPGAIVVEDDARILAPLSGIEPRRDLTYLGGKFLSGPGPVVDGLIEAPYTYWTVGYWITREAAAGLVSAVRSGDIIPVDEFLPWHYGRNPNVTGKMGQSQALGLQAWALPEWIIEPSGRFGSATEDSPSCFALDTYVFATEPERAEEAIDSYSELGYQPVILGRGEAGWDTSGPGGIQKLRWLRAELERRDPSHSIALAVDGYDTLSLTRPDDFLQRFSEMEADIVISGERTCWPDPELGPRFDQLAADDPAPYRYPCSGLVAGFGGPLLEALRGVHDTGQSDDQLYLQRRLLADPEAWRIDRESYLFQSLNHAGDDVGRQAGRPFNSVTRCYPAILHANGPSTMDTARPLPWDDPQLDENAFEWMELADGILGMPFLDRESCARLCSTAECLSNLWQPLPGDNVPGDELRLRKLDLKLWEWLTATLRQHLAPVVEARWRPSSWRDPCDAFLIRYSTRRQPSIRLHEDISYFSGSVKLRRACNGGDLAFPRQNFSDALVPEGWLLLWPAKITHPHQVWPVRKGKRVSLVVWTPDSTR